MNYIYQIKGFWIAHEEFQFEAKEIALYFYLLELWNRIGTQRFRRQNTKIMTDLGIKSYKTFSATRERLRECKIIEFNQLNGEPNVEYFLSDLGIFYSTLGKGYGKGYGQGYGIVNINQTKLNNISSEESGQAASSPEGSDPGLAEEINPPISPDPQEKERKKVAPKKERKPIEHFNPCVAIWFEVYLSSYGRKPTFKSPEAASFKSLLLKLKDSCAEAGKDWTQENATQALRAYLMAARKDNWLCNNFLISNLNRQYDKVLSMAKGGSQMPQNAPKNPQKGSVLQNNLNAAEIAKQMLREQRLKNQSATQ